MFILRYLVHSVAKRSTKTRRRIRAHAFPTFDAKSAVTILAKLFTLGPTCPFRPATVNRTDSFAADFLINEIFMTHRVLDSGPPWNTAAYPPSDPFITRCCTRSPAGPTGDPSAGTTNRIALLPFVFITTTRSSQPSAPCVGVTRPLATTYPATTRLVAVGPPFPLTPYPVTFERVAWSP